MSEMEQARIKATNLDYLNKLTKLDLLVIDDFGLIEYSGRFYTPIPEIGNRRSDVKETALPF